MQMDMGVSGAFTLAGLALKTISIAAHKTAFVETWAKVLGVNDSQVTIKSVQRMVLAQNGEWELGTDEVLLPGYDGARVRSLVARKRRKLNMIGSSSDAALNAIPPTHMPTFQPCAGVHGCDLASSRCAVASMAGEDEAFCECLEGFVPDPIDLYKCAPTGEDDELVGDGDGAGDGAGDGDGDAAGDAAADDAVQPDAVVETEVVDAGAGAAAILADPAGADPANNVNGAAAVDDATDSAAVDDATDSGGPPLDEVNSEVLTRLDAVKDKEEALQEEIDTLTAGRGELEGDDGGIHLAAEDIAVDDIANEDFANEDFANDIALNEEDGLQLEFAVEGLDAEQASAIAAMIRQCTPEQCGDFEVTYTDVLQRLFLPATAMQDLTGNSTAGAFSANDSMVLMHVVKANAVLIGQPMPVEEPAMLPTMPPTIPTGTPSAAPSTVPLAWTGVPGTCDPAAQE
jgi:hypothetical protein